MRAAIRNQNGAHTARAYYLRRTQDNRQTLVPRSRNSLETCAQIKNNQVFTLFGVLLLIFCVMRAFLRLSSSGVYVKYFGVNSTTRKLFSKGVSCHVTM